MRLALLSNVTVEVLAGMLKKEHALWLPPGFGGWMETALAIPEDLKAFEPEAVFLLLDSSHAAYTVEARNQAKLLLEAALPKTTVIVPDLEDLAAEVGGFYDERMWKLGSMPWSMLGLRAIKGEISRLCGMMKGGAKKVLALDFDNTLWKGVIGEDGVAGVEPFVEFQREVKALKERGVLLIALTKNNESDVSAIWEDPRMVLKREDFVDLRINWESKASNLQASAKMLNLGSDAFVFIDDNPAEREQMKALCPEVSVPDWPVNLRRVARLHFPSLRITAEDRAKTAQYQAEAQRQNLKLQAVDIDSYLQGLEIWAMVHPVTESELPRVAQLSQKTNQFNVCTNRYTIEEVARFVAAPDRILLSVHAGDRFGEQGLVAFVQAVIHGDKAEIVDWVMSCRTMNRRLEYAIQDVFEKNLCARGVKHVTASWRRTLKNVPVAELFDRLGFTRTVDAAESRSYELMFPRTEPLKYHVKMKGQ